MRGGGELLKTKKGGERIKAGGRAAPDRLRRVARGPILGGPPLCSMCSADQKQ
jgi:hypothetical protein